jgi:hypothetical protein
MHPAIDEVRRLKEFQPPQPSVWDNLMKQPWIEQLWKDLSKALEVFLNQIKEAFGHIRPKGLEAHLPENIRDIFSGLIGFILILIGLYALYLVLGWLLECKQGQEEKKSEAIGIFEHKLLINSAHHYQVAQEQAGQQHYKTALQQLYMATLCLLDETAVIRYEATRTNLEYQHTLTSQSRAELKQLFGSMAQRFESIHYGNHLASQEQFERSHHDYESFQAKLLVSHE